MHNNQLKNSKKNIIKSKRNMNKIIFILIILIYKFNKIFK